MLNKTPPYCLFIFLFLFLTSVKGETDFFCSTVDNQFNVDIPCITYQEQPYRATLNFFPSTNNPGTLCWTLASANVTTDNGRCATASDDLNLNLPCVDVNGTLYNVDLKYNYTQATMRECQFILDTAEIIEGNLNEWKEDNGCNGKFPPRGEFSYNCITLDNGDLVATQYTYGLGRSGSMTLRNGELLSFVDEYCGVTHFNCPVSICFSNKSCGITGMYDGFIYKWENDGYFYRLDEVSGEGKLTGDTTAARVKIDNETLSELRKYPGWDGRFTEIARRYVSKSGGFEGYYQNKDEDSLHVVYRLFDNPATCDVYSFSNKEWVLEGEEGTVGYDRCLEYTKDNANGLIADYEGYIIPDWQ